LLLLQLGIARQRCQIPNAGRPSGSQIREPQRGALIIPAIDDVL